MLFIQVRGRAYAANTAESEDMKRFIAMVRLKPRGTTSFYH